MKVLTYFRNSREAKNAGWLIAGKGVQILLSFVVSVLTTRYLGSDNFGIINYANAYVAFFGAFCTLGINSVIIKEFADHSDKQGETIGTAIGLRLLSSVLSVIMITAIVSIVDESDIVIVAVLCSLALVFQAFDTFNHWFQFRYESRVTATVTLAGYLVLTAYKISLLILKKNVKWFAASAALDYACVALLLYIAYRRSGGPRLSFRLEQGKKLLGKSYHYIISSMMAAIYGQTDKIMLKHVLDESTVGLYSLAVTISNLWTFVLTAIIDSMAPTIIQLHAAGEQERYEKKNRQLYAIVIYASLLVGVAFVIGGEFAINLVYGQEYVGAAVPLRIVTWGTLFSYLGTARNVWIVCENQQKYLKYVYSMAAVVNVALNCWMIPLWGTAGAAAALLITQMFCILIPYAIPSMRPNVRLMLDAFLLRGIR